MAAGHKGKRNAIQRQKRVAPEYPTIASSDSVRTVYRGSEGAVFISSTVARLRYFAMV